MNDSLKTKQKRILNYNRICNNGEVANEKWKHYKMNEWISDIMNIISYLWAEIEHSSTPTSHPSPQPPTLG